MLQPMLSRTRRANVTHLQRGAALIGLCLMLTGCADPEVTTGANWMERTVLAYPDRDVALQDVTMVGSHDTGTYAEACCSLLANTCNTETQRLDMGAQLRAGTRVFDVRPMLSAGRYYTRHSQGCDLGEPREGASLCVGGDLANQGCIGASLEELLQQTRDFVEVNSEFVALDVWAFCGTGASDSGLVDLILDTLGERIYTEATPRTEPIGTVPLRELVPPGGGGKVLVGLAGIDDTPQNRARGLFPRDYLGLTGVRWYAVQDLEGLQERELQGYRDDGTGLYSVAWTVTQDFALAAMCLDADPDASQSIYEMTLPIHEALEPMVSDLIAGAQGVAPGNIPNVLGLDFIDDTHWRQAMRLTEFNLSAE